MGADAYRYRLFHPGRHMLRGYAPHFQQRDTGADLVGLHSVPLAFRPWGGRDILPRFQRRVQGRYHQRETRIAVHHTYHHLLLPGLPAHLPVSGKRGMDVRASRPLRR